MSAHAVDQLLLEPVCFVELLLRKEAPINGIVLLSEVEYLLASRQTLLRGKPASRSKCPYITLIPTIGVDIFMSRCRIEGEFAGYVFGLKYGKFFPRHSSLLRILRRCGITAHQYSEEYKNKFKILFHSFIVD